MRRWFIRDGEKELGPFTAADLRKMVAQGALHPSTLLRSSEMADPVAARKVAGLFVRPTPPDASSSPTSQTNIPNLVAADIKPNSDPAAQAPLLAEIVDEPEGDFEALFREASPWNPPTKEDFQRDSRAALESILRQCESVQKRAHAEDTDVQFLVDFLKQIQAACALASQHDSQLMQARQRKAVDDARRPSDEGATQNLLNELKQAEQANDQAGIERIKQSLEKLRSQIAASQARIKSDRQELQDLHARTKILEVIKTIVSDISAQVRGRLQAAEEKKRQDIDQAKMRAGKDAFVGLSNPQADSFQSWYRRFFGPVVRQPLVLSLALQAPLWCCGGFLLIPGFYFLGKMFSCPACGALFSRKVSRREILASDTDVATVVQHDRHYTRDGTQTGYTKRKEQVLVNRKLVKIHYHCKTCQHEWFESQVEQHQV